jgi:sterol desaturase/sphingolipid hydroxylase (fatty acid hydroxylase superfamily)
LFRNLVATFEHDIGKLVPAVVTGVLAGTACTIAELVRPARPMPYRQVLLRDCVAFALYIAAIYPLAEMFAGMIGRHRPIHVFAPFWKLPFPVRMIIFYLVADLGSYLLHRFMHTRWFWRFHKWHHAPTYMYWFAGTRASIFQQFLFNLPVVFALPIVANAPHWFPLFLSVELILRNDWMHMNVAWRSNWLEWIFVTPRYHAIHHSADPAHHGNYGSLFSIWDRIFGTRIDPDTVTPTQFGIGPNENPVRVILGV